jgi:GNAT superfamily N-acetyltransferase
MMMEQYTPHWHRAVLQLMTEVSGEHHFVDLGQLAKQSNVIMLLSCENDTDLAGFTQGRLLPLGGLREHLEHRIGDISSEIEEADQAGALGVIETIAVAPEYRRRRIAQNLLEALHDKLVGIGADKLIITFKRGPSATNVDNLMTRLGFAPWTRLPSYWKDRCDKREFVCVDWDGSCKCEAALYSKKVL